MTDPAILELAASVLTPKQLEAWELETDGWSQRAIALKLDISKSTLIDRLDGAHRRLRRNGVKMTSAGVYYLEETTTA